MKYPWDLFMTFIFNYLHEDGRLPIFVLDAEDRLEYYNKAFQGLVPDDGQTLLGQFIGTVFDEDTSAALKIAYQTLTYNKRLWYVNTAQGSLRFECHIYNKEGRRMVIAEKQIVTGDDIIAKIGSLNLELANMARDLERKNFIAETANRSLRAEIGATMAQAERLSVLASMAAGVAHEIAQPLNSIKLAADSAVFWHSEGHAVSTDEVISDMEVISRQADKIDNIIRHMRTLVYKRSIEVEACDLNAAVQNVLCDVRGALADLDIRLYSSFDEELPPVLANSVAVGEVVTNLAVNAIKALRETNRPEKVLSVRTANLEDCAVLEVSDNGPGIDEAIRGRIFEPFFTTDQSDKSMGLGLSIVRAVVAAHNGQIDVFPNQQQGTTFRVKIPLAAVAAAGN